MWVKEIQTERGLCVCGKKRGGGGGGGGSTR